MVFSVATAVQFVNNADDEVRGAANNPFGAASAKLEPKLSLKGEGPFAGDVTVYSFDLYGDAALHRKVGSASLTCYYNYRAHALCLAYYELAAGTVVASGPVDFTKTGFTLVVTGGTHRYLGAAGELDAAASGRGSQRLAFRFVPAAVGGRSRLSVVEVPMTAQFMNHADDRIRGMTNNPFDVQSRDLVIVTKGKEKANGPFPGDDVLYTFDLKDAVGGGRVGSAIFTCYYLFLKRATCDAYLDLPGGTLLASGTVAFDASRFTPGRERRHWPLSGPWWGDHGPGRRGERAPEPGPDLTRMPAAPLPVWLGPRLRRRVAAVVGVVALAGLTAAGSAVGSRQRSLTLYAVATAAQFVNHADDRARGSAINPFNADTKALVPAANAKEKGKGPYPGDDALYSFNLYDAASLSHRIGTATLTCVYNFSQQAICEASIQTTSGHHVRLRPRRLHRRLRHPRHHRRQRHLPRRAWTTHHLHRGPPPHQERRTLRPHPHLDA